MAPSRGTDLEQRRRRFITSTGHRNRPFADYDHDDEVVSELMFPDTHDGTLMTPNGPVTRTGRNVSLQGTEVREPRDGKRAALRNNQDAASLMRQLGLLA